MRWPRLLRRGKRNQTTPVSLAARPALGSQLECDVAVLTVIGKELEAVRTALALGDDARLKDESGSVFWTGAVHSQLTDRDYSLVVGVVGTAGNPDCAAAAMEMIKEFRPALVVLCGIAAGIRNKVRVGDVVVSERVWGYESGAEVITESRGQAFVPRPRVSEISHTLVQDLAVYEPGASRRVAVALSARVAAPSAPSGRNEEYRKHVADSIHVRVATIASGEKLLRDPARLKNLRDMHHGRIEAGEMEATGLATACQRAGKDWLVIRGISDFGDELKDDNFHEYASSAAATCLLDFLRHGLDLNQQRTARSSPSSSSEPSRAVRMRDVLTAPRGRSSATFTLTVSVASTFDELLDGPHLVRHLTASELVDRGLHQRLLVHGAGGAGKSHFIGALAVAALDKGRSVFLMTLSASCFPEESQPTLSDLAALVFTQSDDDLEATIRSGRSTLVIVDGLNEILPAQADAVVGVLIRLQREHSNVEAVVTDRMQARVSARAFLRASIDPLSDGTIDALVPPDMTAALSPSHRTLLSLPFFLDLQLVLWEKTDTTRGMTRRAMFERYFRDRVGLTAENVAVVASAAFDACGTFGTTSFDEAWWVERVGAENRESLQRAGAVVRDVARGRVRFWHQLLHEYLVGSHVANGIGQRWTAAVLDQATYKASSQESLSFTAEILEARADAFIKAVYDWNYGACFQVFVSLSETGGREFVSDDLRFALSALVAEKKFDRFEETSRGAEARLQRSRDDQAALFQRAASLDEVRALVERLLPAAEWSPAWRKLFLAKSVEDIGGEWLHSLWADPVFGWTAANVLRRIGLSEAQVSAVRAVFRVLHDLGAQALVERGWESVPWRIVHVLGHYPSRDNVELLEQALGSSTLNDWAKYGALRSLMEIAESDAGLRPGVLDFITASLGTLQAAHLLRELRRTALVSGADVDWYERMTHLVQRAAKLPNARKEADQWDLTLTELSKRAARS
jgi:nucleoside phosphorylase